MAKKKKRAPKSSVVLPDPPVIAPARSLVVWSIVAFGILLRTIAWLGRADLWLDEVAIARNVLDRSLWELLVVPLDYGQTAPKGFLLLEWLVTRVAGSGDAALRFIPWVAGVSSLFAFKRLAERVLERTGLVAALVIFAVGQPFVFYGAESKQYTLDLAISLWLIAETLTASERGWPRDRTLRLALLGFVAVWFSQFAVITVTALGLAVAIFESRRGIAQAARTLWPLAVAWGLAAAAGTFVSFRSVFPATLGYMRWFHEVNMPHGGDPLWFWNRLRGMMVIDQDWTIGDRRWTVLYPSLALVGLVILAWRRRAAAAVVIAPLVLTFGVVAAHQYPLIVRLALVPLAILAIGIGALADEIDARMSRLQPKLAVALGLLVVVPAIVRLLMVPPPYQLATAGPVLRAVKAQWRSGDRMFVPFEAAMVTDYYAPRLGLREGVDYIHADCDRGQAPGQLAVLDQFRGAPRVWVITNVGAGNRPPLELLYAGYVGTLLDSVPAPMPGSFGSRPPGPFENNRAFLFDFSDSARLATRPPGSLKVGRPPPRGELAVRRADPKWCYGVFMPHIRESRGEITPAWQHRDYDRAEMNLR